MKLSSMHVLLDITEKVVMEALAHSGQGKDAAREGKQKVTELLDDLYAPEPQTELNIDEYLPLPAGFEPEQMEASFDAAAKALGSAR